MHLSPGREEARLLLGIVAPAVTVLVSYIGALTYTYLTERQRGSFRRQVHLGDSLDTDNIEADFADGVLTIRLPISAAAKPRKIPVGARAEQTAIDVESVSS